LFTDGTEVVPLYGGEDVQNALLQIDLKLGVTSLVSGTEESFTIVPWVPISSHNFESSFDSIAFFLATMLFHSNTEMTDPLTDFMRNEHTEIPPSDFRSGACFLRRVRSYRSCPSFAR
jgi:hypothetical protein